MIPMCLVVMHVYCAPFSTFFLYEGAPKMFFCPKIIVFAPKSSFPAISGSSRIKWVEHWSNWAEYYIWHLGWSVEGFNTPWKSPWGTPGGLKNDNFCPKIIILGASWGPPWTFPGGLKKVPTDHPGCEIQCSTQFDRCSTHLRLMAGNDDFGAKTMIWGQK